MSEVSIKISNVWLYISGNISDDLRKEIQTKLSFIVPGFKFMAAYKTMAAKAATMGSEPEWDGTRTVARITQFGELRAPTGLLSYVREILNGRNIKYTIEERRLPVIKSTGWSTVPEFKLRDYQQGASDAALNKQRGVMKISTGGGKTECIVDNIIRASCFPAMFYVPSCDLLEQTYDRFSKYVLYNGQPAKIGRIGAGHCDIQPITIATVQSCQLALTGKFTKYEQDDVDFDDDTKFSQEQKQQITELVKEAQYTYVDECQHTSAETIQSVLNSSLKARIRIGGSASPWRDDGLDILIEACFGKKLCDIDASFLINQGYLIKPEITFNHFRQFLGKAANFNAHYTKFIVENTARNQFVAQRALFHMERGRPTFILVKWSRHAEILAELIPGCEVLTSSGSLKRSPKKRKDVLQRMRDRQLMAIIGTTLLDEGVDVPSAGAGILAGGGKSSTRALQRVGRFIRPDTLDPNKDIAYIEEFFDHCRWLDHHATARRRIYETERAFHIMDNRNTMVL